MSENRVAPLVMPTGETIWLPVDMLVYRDGKVWTWIEVFPSGYRQGLWFPTPTEAVTDWQLSCVGTL